jgi:hypothetical protein
MSHVEYALCGANVVELLKEGSVSTLQSRIAAFKESDRNVKASYLEGFRGYFTFTYKITDNEDITAFEVEDSRYVNPSRGGRCVSGGFKDKLFGKKIFMNLLNAAAAKDVKKLNSTTGALYTIGG